MAGHVDIDPASIRLEARAGGHIEPDILGGARVALAAMLRPCGYDWRRLPVEQQRRALDLARTANIELPPLRPERRGMER